MISEPRLSGVSPENVSEMLANVVEKYMTYNDKIKLYATQRKHSIMIEKYAKKSSPSVT